MSKVEASALFIKNLDDGSFNWAELTPQLLNEASCSLDASSYLLRKEDMVFRVKRFIRKSNDCLLNEAHVL
jgi:hypothetical protein